MAIAPRPQHTPVLHSITQSEPFRSAEEAWFWTMAALVARRYLEQLFAADPAIDTLVLGCTHYPVFKPTLKRVLGRLLDRDVALVDSAEPIAKALQQQLGEPVAGDGQIELLATDAVERFQRVGGLFFPVGKAAVELVDL